LAETFYNNNVRDKFVEGVYLGKKNAAETHVSNWSNNISNIQNRCTNEAIESFKTVDEET
jgi:hypothetical protein